MDLADLGALADRLEAARQSRLAADRIAADLKSDENKIKAEIISEMEAGNLSSIGGKVCVLNRAVKQRAIAGDWPAIHKYILENDAFDILHRRLTDAAIKERLDDGVEIPGISLMDYSHITFAKAK